MGEILRNSGGLLAKLISLSSQSKFFSANYIRIFREKFDC